jgi:hypothetical protein
MAARMKTAPHASLSCQCVACQRAPIRREANSKVVRPIAKGCAITQMAERAMCFHYKKRMQKALAPIQSRVAVVGGAAMGVYMLDCMMRLDPAKAQLNVDIQNMCNALYCTALHCTALHCIALHCTARYGTAHGTVLTVRYCTVLYYTVL